LIFLGAGTNFDDVSDDCRIDLLVQKLFVIFQNFSDGALCHEIILDGGHHALMEKVRDPLSGVEFVEIVLLHAMFDQTVDQLANSRHRTLLRQIFQIIQRVWTLKGIN
jgi:hypothetical protein